MVTLRGIVAALAAASSLGQCVLAVPARAKLDLDLHDIGAENITDPFTNYPAILRSRQSNLELRILPLGASIMEGVGSTHHSG